MASIRSILGTIEGSAGTITFASRGGLNVLKQKVGKNNSKTVAQQKVRAKFGALGLLAKHLGPMLKAGLKTVGGATAYNRFMGPNYAYTGVDDALAVSIDYAKLELSAGSVTPLAGLAVAAGPNGAGKTVSWADNSDGNNALSDDKVYVAAVKKSTGEVVLSLGDTTRAAGSVDLSAGLLSGLAAEDLAVYAFARRAMSSDASPTTRVTTGGTAPAPSPGSYDTTVAGPNGDSAGVTLAASAGDQFKFNALTSGSSAPANMDINLGGTQVASVAYLSRYVGKPFSFTHAGTAHTGSFGATVNF